jgi:hypothetical protein
MLVTADDRVAMPMITQHRRNLFHAAPPIPFDRGPCAVYPFRSTSQGGHVPKDFAKFANQRFLKTVNWEVLGRLLASHAQDIKGLDLILLATSPAEGRKQACDFLLGPRENYPSGLVHALHRIVRLDSALGMQLILDEAERQKVTLLEPAAQATATPRDIALLAFVDYPDVFLEAEHTSVFIPPPSVSEYNAREEGVTAEVTLETVEALRLRAADLFAADLRGQYCRVRPYEDDGELCIAVRHGAPPVSTEIIKGEEDGVIGFQEVDTAVISYAEITGRLTVWGCAKKRRGDLAEAFATHILGQPGLFKAADAQRLYTLAPLERSGGTFAFRKGDDEEIDHILIVEAQANRVATNVKTGREMTLFALTLRDPGGNALKLLHQSRTDIDYGNNAWRLGHITARIVLKAPDRRAPTITVKIKPDDSVSFQRSRHRKRVMTLLALNNLVHARQPDDAALAAE